MMTARINIILRGNFTHKDIEEEVKEIENLYNNSPAVKQFWVKNTMTADSGEQEPVKLKCYKCKHIWTYKGQGNNYISCPSCQYKIIKEKAIYKQRIKEKK